MLYSTSNCFCFLEKHKMYFSIENLANALLQGYKYTEPGKGEM